MKFESNLDAVSAFIRAAGVFNAVAPDEFDFDRVWNADDLSSAVRAEVARVNAELKALKDPFGFAAFELLPDSIRFGMGRTFTELRFASPVWEVAIDCYDLANREAAAESLAKREEAARAKRLPSHREDEVRAAALGRAYRRLGQTSVDADSILALERVEGGMWRNDYRAREVLIATLT